MNTTQCNIYDLESKPSPRTVWGPYRKANLHTQSAGSRRLHKVKNFISRNEIYHPNKSMPKIVKHFKLLQENYFKISSKR